MQESPFYTHVIEQGVVQGARQTNIDNTLATLEARFPEADLNTLKTRLEAITDIEKLKQITLNASLATSFQDFKEKIG